MDFAWQHGLVERHAHVLAGITRAIFAETHVAGTEQLKAAILTAALAKNRRPGRTCYRPISFICGLDERFVARGPDHYLEQPIDAVLARNATAHLRHMQYRNIAMIAAVQLDRTERWMATRRYPSRPV